LIRIVPTYYIFTLGAFFLAIIYPDILVSTTANIEHLIKSLVFIPFDKNGTGHYPILFFGWTLNYEIYFYAIFALALKINHAYCGEVTALMIIFIWFICSPFDSLPLSAYGNLIVIEFIFGIFSYNFLFKKNYWSMLYIGIITATPLLFGIDLFNQRAYSVAIASLIFVCTFLWVFRFIRFPKIFV